MDTKELNECIEVWKVLEILTVSLDRLGTYWRTHGEEEGKQALHLFFTPELPRGISLARTSIISVMERHEANIREHLEILAENEADMGYWNGPN
jgi:hypothetical protein